VTLVVGVLGCGRMGSAMARALARDGVSLVLYNRTPARAAELAAELGMRAAATPAEVAAEATVSLSMLADGAAVEEVYTGPDGLLAGARDGTVLVDLSTVAPSTIQGMAPLARGRGAGILDAPVSGSVGLAEAGELTLMVGGEAPDLELARPALEPLAKRIVHVGPLGSGAAMKLAVNAVIFGLNNVLSEALVLAERAGIAREVAYDVFATSAVAAPYVGYKRAAFLQPESTPVAFSLELAAKDLELIRELVRATGSAGPQSGTALATIRDAIETEGADADFSAVAVHLRRRVAQQLTGAAGGG
jgi:3-hydroxyisobutyrate dehydrogenase/2-hydroxy-3-oxopropionate reductase